MGLIGEGVLIPHHDVGVLTRRQAALPVVDAQHLGRIDGDRLQPLSSSMPSRTDSAA